MCVYTYMCVCTYIHTHKHTYIIAKKSIPLNDNNLSQNPGSTTYSPVITDKLFILFKAGSFYVKCN